MKITNVPKNVLNLIQKKKILNASNILHFRRTARHTISKPSQKIVAEKLLKSKKFPRKNNLSARNSQKIGYSRHPVHMLNSNLTEDNVALWNAARQELRNKWNVNTNINNNYYQLLNLLSNKTGNSVNNVNARLRRTAPRGLNYVKVSGGNIKNRVNTLHRRQVGLPGRVQKRLNKFSKQTPSMIRYQLKKYLTPGGYWKKR